MVGLFYIPIFKYYNLKVHFKILMPIDLRKAHQANDMAVMEAYGFYHTDENGKKIWFKEDETVAVLMQIYQDLIKQ